MTRWIGPLLLPLLAVFSQAQPFSPTCSPSGSAPPCNDTPKPTGRFKIAVAPKFQPVLAAAHFPGYDTSTHKYTSPILYDPSTTISRSVVITEGSNADLSGVTVGYPPAAAAGVV